MMINAPKQRWKTGRKKDISKAQGAGLRAQGTGHRVQGTGLRAQGPDIQHDF
jgi:hypothetical protein